MKYLFKVSSIIGILVCFTFNVNSQNLPNTANKDKCYGKAKTPNKYYIQEEKVLVRPAFEQEIIIPAEYKTLQEKIAIETERKRIIIPTTSTDFQSLDKVNQTKPKVVMNLIPITESANLCNNDCDETPAKPTRYFDTFEKLAENMKTKTNKMLEREKFENLISNSSNTIKGIAENSEKTLNETSYKIVERKVLIKPEETTTTIVPAQFKTIQHKTLLKEGGQVTWVEVLCPKSIDILLVTQLQLALKSRNYYHGELHGILSYDVRAALVEFQQDKELPLGQLDKITLETLGFNYNLISTKKSNTQE